MSSADRLGSDEIWLSGSCLSGRKNPLIRAFQHGNMSTVDRMSMPITIYAYGTSQFSGSLNMNCVPPSPDGRCGGLGYSD